MKSARLWILLTAVVLLLGAAGFVWFTPPLASLLSLHKVDDFPLYTMKYRGDYDFWHTNGIDRVPEITASTWQSEVSFACTVFYGRTETGEALLGRNFDWKHKASMLLYTHPRDGYASVSMVDLGYFGFDTGKPTREAYLSLRDAPFWPFDGMNERGVGIGIMAVPDTPGLHDPAKLTLDSLSVVRLVLDYASNLDEAIALIQSVNVDFGSGPWLHYLVSDPQQSAVIEILSDRVNIIRSEQPWQVSTNFILTGVSEAQSDAACWRYQTASDDLEQRQGVIKPDEAMGLLEKTSQESTVWSVVYNLSSGEIQVALGRDYADVHVFELGRPLQEIR